MKVKSLLLIALVLCLSMSIAQGGSKSSVKGKNAPSKAAQMARLRPSGGRQYLPGQIIMKLKTNIAMAKTARTFGVASLDQLTQRYSVQSVSQMFPGHDAPSAPGQVDLSRIYVMKYSAPMDAFKVSGELSQHPDVEYAEPWYIYSTNGCTPNDPYRSYQWGLTRILADSAWCISTGDTSIIIGILDTGVQWDHPDIYPNIWHNPNWQTDTDYPADSIGWDFGGADYNNPTQDNNPAPTGYNNAHGTETGGVASAATNNATGVAGVGYKCRIMAIKTSSDNDTRDGGDAYIVFWLQGLVYAADRGASVVNCSFGGGGGASQAEQEVINYATSKGTLVVAAAGNSTSMDPFYPASYDNVLSVAAVQQSGDVLSTYSNYGPTVDVCAPGDDIFTTDYSNRYSYVSGTSLATPHVAGLAALVKSMHPSYTALQVGEQVRVSCDDISALNGTFYQYYLGRGRINAVKALTDTTSPSVRMTSYTLSDSAGGNNNGVPESGETIAIYSTFTNYLAPTSSNAKITLASSDPASIQVLDSVYSLGALSTLGTATNSATPFRVKIGKTVGGDTLVYLKLSIQDGSYSDFQYFQILVNQLSLYATHDVNNVRFSVSNFGSLGYYDYVQGTQVGIGFQFPSGTPSALYHASLMVGTDSNHVSDNAYGNPSNPNAVDFVAASNGNIAISKERSADQVIKCAFTDSGVTPLSNSLGLYVTQRSYAYDSAPDSDYITLRYDIRNNSPSKISQAYVGIFADWDVVDANTNLLGYDAARRLGYQWDPGDTHWDPAGQNYYGVCLVYPTTAASFQAVNNPTYIYGADAGFTEANKYLFLSQGFVTTQGQDISDWSMVLSAGPYTINSGDSVTVGFAFVGGKNLADIQAHADAAIAKWPLIMGVDNEHGSVVPATYALRQNYPNPFNPTTEIMYDLPNASWVSLKVFDVLGREVETLLNGEQPAGSYRVPFNASRLSSGVYFYRLTADAVAPGPQQSYTNVKKLLLVR